MPAQQPTILLLREGTDTSQGKAQLVSNINAIGAVVDVLRTTLGPRGMDKLIHKDNQVTISNDGATLMKLLDVVHPAAKTLVDIARSQDAEVGDGTTSVVVIAGEFLREIKSFVEDGVHPQIIIKAFRSACEQALVQMDKLKVTLTTESDVAPLRDMLEKQAATSLSSKLVSGHKAFFAKMVVSAVLSLGEDMPVHMIGIKKVQGGALQDSVLVEGVAFKKTFSYAGFEQQPKYFTDVRIVLLNVELELKAEKDNAEIRISKPSVRPAPTCSARPFATPALTARRFARPPVRRAGVPGHRRRGVADHLRQARPHPQDGRAGGALQAPNRRPSHAVFCRPQRVLCRARG